MVLNLLKNVVDTEKSGGTQGHSLHITKYYWISIPHIDEIG